MIDAFVEAAERRYLTDITFQEARRALQALSTIYVQKRDQLARGAALDGRGKRAAFAFFYGPLHMLLVQHIVEALGANDPPPKRIIDLGCGTGAGAAGWASVCDTKPMVIGIDVDSWAVSEAKWTYGQLGLQNETRKGNAETAQWPDDGAVIAAYTVNELSDEGRATFLKAMLAAKTKGCRTLIVEPIAKRPVPWWPEWSQHVLAAGGRDDAWNIPAELPARLRLMDKAAGLKHDRLKGRTLYL